MKRHELWRMQYNDERYMIPLDQEELDVRFADFISNVSTLSDEGLISIQKEWMEPWTHMLEEYALRGIGLPDAQSIKDAIVFPRASNLELANRIRKQFPKGFPESFKLFKYGQKKYLRPMFDTGLIRLSPASKYNDPSLNTSIRDDELNFTKILPSGRITYTSEYDYYCFCSSWIHNNRLVADFSADCVIVIKDPHEFFRRMLTAFQGEPGKVVFNKVNYIDPLLPGDGQLDSIAFVKHFRFSYQFEHRLVIWLENATHNLDYEFISMDSLEDIAEIYEA